ncbi:type VI secretion system Vgr family protein [Massilia sp. CFBP9012]|uniref:type VI secretion system Vgr family protein n=1 Tax=Massilia sp. CFBP9012 TaxID=3096531 RepID=UPI002A6AE100|nr:type VI secretion system Vgr family protein [Massilia sp. CFBP9012]MDY0976387.1 type VI secretion system Vgr family protein [Massilia sp. CFBP9012]
MNLNDLIEGFTSLSESHRPIRLRFSRGQQASGDVLLVQRVSGTESLCGGLEYRLLCVSTRADLALKDFIALPVELQFVTDRGNMRGVCGIVAQAAAGQSDGGLATYELVLRDALALMEQRTSTRVFRNMNELDITQVIVGEWRRNNPVLARAFDVEWSHVKGMFPAREFTMQHNESDADFLRRLWKRRGIAWFMRSGLARESQGEDMPAHTLVLFDDGFTLPQNAAGVVRYHRDGGTEQSDTIFAWSPVRKLVPGNLNRLTWDYLQGRPMTANMPSCIDQGATGNRFALGLDDYLIDVPHAGADGDDYRELGELRMKRHEYESKCFYGEGSVRALCIGEWIALSGHPDIDTHAPQEREFVITCLEVDAQNNLPKTLDDRIQRLFALNRWHEVHFDSGLQQASAERGMRYMNRFACVRRSIPIVPAFDPRTDLPRPQLQSAIVVGPPGEEVHCDEHGRVKVRFPGTRVEDHAHAQGAGASGSDRDSAWIRVASTWASNQWGTITLPRVGDEVLVGFLGGDPDKPIIVGQVYGRMAPPPAFSHAGALPGNRYVAGIKSKEVGGDRYNQLRLDDTSGQINAQLSSQHGHSELNLGWLTHPRKDGKGEARGEGAELRSDLAVALRGAQGVLISAAARQNAGGKQLDRSELLGLAEVLQGLQKQLAELASTHHADSTDDAELEQLIGYLKQWEAGSNAEKVGAGGQPVVAVSAPAGVAMTSQDNIAIGAQTHVDVLSIGNTQLSVGRKLLARVSESISLFAHRLGIKLIAAGGKLELQTHGDDIEVTSSKRIVLTATDEIVLQAPKVRIVAQGAQVDIGAGVITQQSSGEHTIKSSKFAHIGPGGGSPAAVTPSKSEAQHDQQTVLRWIGTDEPMKNQRYRITTEDGRSFEGRTDANGLTERFSSAIPFGRYSIEALDD